MGAVVLLVRGVTLTCLCSATDLWCEHKVGHLSLGLGARVQEGNHLVHCLSGLLSIPKAPEWQS